MAFAETGNESRAAELYELVLHDPHAQPILILSATTEAVRIYAHLGRKADARRLLAGSIHMATRESARTMGLAALEIGDVDHAIRFLMMTDDPYHLGVALLMQGDTQLAIGCLRHAPHDAQSQLMLGVAYAQLGNVVEARRSVEEALRLQPGMPEAKLLLSRLPQGQAGLPQK
jgi:Flp pilus assembly protein TadD